MLDASTLVSALLKPGSIPAQAVELARRWASVATSDAVAEEIRSVVLRPKFRRYVALHDAERFLAMLLSVARRVDPVEIVTDCRDPKDNMYLELALAAGADIIISSDNDLLTLDPWRGIRILSPAAFIVSFAA